MSFSFDQARPLRWLVVAPWSVPPTGRVTEASGERFKTLMARVGPKATVSLPAGLGSSLAPNATLEFKRPRDFRLSDILQNIEALAALRSIADRLDQGTPLETAVTSLHTIVGEGELLQMIERMRDGKATTAPPSAAPPSNAPPTPSSSTEATPASAIDAIFSKADVASPAQPDITGIAKSGLDAFIGAMRSSSGTGSATKSVPAQPLAREVATLIRQTCEGVAIAVMTTPVVASLETSWRGLHMLIATSPGHSDVAIDMLNSDEVGLLERLTERLEVEPMERPDAVFIPQSIDSLETLAALAQLGARASVPIIVESSESVTGAELDDRTELDPPSEGWSALQARPECAWLCVCTNAIVLANDQLDTLSRPVFGSPVIAVASMITASVGQTGSPGQIFGQAGALLAPASYSLPSAGATQVVATEELPTIDRQRALAERGVLVVSGERNSERLRLAAAPTVHPGPDRRALPERILAGRATRFTRAIRDDLPANATEQEVAARLAQASGNFLPRRQQAAVHLDLRPNEDGTIGMDASIGASLAGASFKFSSDL